MKRRACMLVSLNHSGNPSLFSCLFLSPGRRFLISYVCFIQFILIVLAFTILMTLSTLYFISLRLYSIM